MSGAQLFRLSGLVLVVGAIAALVGNGGTGILFPDNGNPTYALSPLYVPLNLLALVGTILLLLGLPGLYASRSREAGALGLAGIVLIALTGMMFGIFFGLFAVLFQPFLAARAPELLSGEPAPGFFPFFILGSVFQVVGSVLFALHMLSGRVRPRWPGYLLVISALLAIGTFLLTDPSSSSTPLSIFLNVASPALLFIVLGWLGYQLLAGDQFAVTRVEHMTPEPPSP